MEFPATQKSETYISDNSYKKQKTNGEIWISTSLKKQNTATLIPKEQYRSHQIIVNITYRNQINGN
jgi:hypothetical protein